MVTLCNPLDHYFWNKVKEKVYSGHHAKRIESEKELKDRIWSMRINGLQVLNFKAKIWTLNFEAVLNFKQFLSCLKVIVTKEERSVKTTFG